MCRGEISLAALALFIGQASTLFAQSGQATAAAQSYYLRIGSQVAAETNGAVLTFQEFLPGTGLLRGSLEGYLSEGSLQPADNYLQLHGLIWQGLRWNFNAGDFRAPATLLHNPFTNLFFPEINARGFEVDAGDSRQGFTFFYGNETLLAGPRIPFRVDVPQRVMGAGIRRKFGHLETGMRFLRLVDTPRDPSQDSFFPAGRDFRSAENLTLSSAYTFGDHFRWYGEATVARTEPFASPVSYFFGPAWESPRVTVRVNYANLSRSYFPLAGYWTGDRKGPFAEIRVRPLHRLEFFGSANRYESVSKPADNLPFLRSTGMSAGLSLELPWKWSASAQLSVTDFHSSDPTSDAVQSASNRQWTGTLSRHIGAQTLRFTGRDMWLTANGVASREGSAEVEDIVQIRHVVVGGGVRAEQAAGLDRRNAVYVHGLAQINLGRFNASAFFEGGKDLANQTVFATNTTNSATVSVGFRLSRRWSVSGEAFRSRLVSQINPENLFVQGNQDLVLNPILSQFSQWSFLFRVERAFNWGSALPATGLDQFTVQRIPITGSVEGVVYVLTSSGRLPAASVTVSLESGRSATSDAEGRYRLPDVAEGPHVVSLDMERLPADYNPGPNAKIPVVVGPRKISRADFALYNLAAFAGKVAVSPGSEFDALDGIVIRLEPGGRYTTTAKDGNFAFYNLPDGDYQASVAAETLPPEARLKGEAAVPVVMRTGSAPPEVRFEIERTPAGDKPVRKVLDKVLDKKQ